MEHQGQRDSERGHHHERIGRDEEVRGLEGKEVGPPWGGHSSHRDRENEISDAKEAPRVDRSASSIRVQRQQRGHNDGHDSGRNIPNPGGQGELPRESSVGHQHEEYAASDAIDLGRHEPR